MKPFPIINRDQRRTAAGICISLLLHALALLLFIAHTPVPPESTGSAARTPLVVQLNRQPQGRQTAPPPALAPLPVPASPPPQPPRPKTSKPPAPARPRTEKPTASKQAAPRTPAPPRAVSPMRLP